MPPVAEPLRPMLRRVLLARGRALPAHRRSHRGGKGGGRPFIESDAHVLDELDRDIALGGLSGDDGEQREAQRDGASKGSDHRAGIRYGASGRFAGFAVDNNHSDIYATVM